MYIFQFSTVELAVLGGLWLLSVVLALYEHRRGKINSRSVISFAISSLAFIVAIDRLNHLTKPLFDRENAWVAKMTSTHPLASFRIVAPFVVGTLGLFAFWLKKKHPEGYAKAEIVFGLIATDTIANDANAVNHALVIWIGLGTCAYIVAEGLHNLKEAGTDIDIVTVARAIQRLIGSLEKPPKRA
jgi:hypothetical protein